MCAICSYPFLTGLDLFAKPPFYNGLSYRENPLVLSVLKNEIFINGGRLKNAPVSKGSDIEFFIYVLCFTILKYSSSQKETKERQLAGFYTGPAVPAYRTIPV